MAPENKHFSRLLAYLKEQPLFQGLDDDMLIKILKCSISERWPAGTLKNGTEVLAFMHLIVSGRLNAYKINLDTGRECSVRFLSDGDVFDILGQMHQDVHEIYWRSIDELVILKVPMSLFSEAMAKCPCLNKNMFSYTAKTLRQMERDSADMVFLNTLERLAWLLLKNTNPDSLKLETIADLSNGAIASLVGTTRAVVNRHLQELKSCGAISITPKNIDIIDETKLRSIIGQKNSA